MTNELLIALSSLLDCTPVETRISLESHPLPAATGRALTDFAAQKGNTNGQQDCSCPITLSKAETRIATTVRLPRLGLDAHLSYRGAGPRNLRWYATAALNGQQVSGFGGNDRTCPRRPDFQHRSRT